MYKVRTLRYRRAQEKQRNATNPLTPGVQQIQVAAESMNENWRFRKPAKDGQITLGFSRSFHADDAASEDLL